MIFRWLRSYIRKNTTPIPLDKAFKSKESLSIIYMFIAANTFCYALYKALHSKKSVDLYGERDDSIARSVQWANSLNLSGNIRVFQFKGLQKTGEYEFYKEDSKEKIISEK